MHLAAIVRSRIKASRKRRARWVRVLDIVRLLPRGAGRAELWTRFAYSDEFHQTTADTAEERYPQLFDLTARLSPKPEVILSFGCSTGEELMSIRRRFPEAEIVGVELNPRSRRISARRVALDRRASVYRRVPDRTFDIVFALAVLQRQPHKMREMAVRDLSPFYPFAKFDSAVRDLVGSLNPGGLLCVQNAHYRVEASSIADQLEAIAASPELQGELYGRDGRRLDGASARTMFRKRDV